MRSSPRRALGPGGIEHAGAQHAKLELADAALHAEQKPIIRPAGVIDPVQVDHSRLDQATEFEQVMPVTTVAGEPGRVEAQYGPDLPGTEPRYQPLEAGPRHHPAGGAAEVIIDDLDVAEAPAPRDIDELVLAPLALKVAVDLRLGGLPDIDHRLALQHRGGQEISARHRHAPRPRRQWPPAEGRPAGRAPCRAPRGSSPEAFRRRTEC